MLYGAFIRNWSQKHVNRNKNISYVLRSFLNNQLIPLFDISEKKDYSILQGVWRQRVWDWTKEELRGSHKNVQDGMAPSQLLSEWTCCRFYWLLSCLSTMATVRRGWTLVCSKCFGIIAPLLIWFNIIFANWIHDAQ